MTAEREDTDYEDGRDSDGDDSDNDSDEESGDTDEDIDGGDEEAATAADQYEADVRTELENGLEISASVLSAAAATVLVRTSATTRSF